MGGGGVNVKVGSGVFVGGEVGVGNGVCVGVGVWVGPKNGIALHPDPLTTNISMTVTSANLFTFNSCALFYQKLVKKQKPLFGSSIRGA